MSIADFIQNEVLLPRLTAQGVVVIYDPARRYRELCAGLATENRKVVDATETSISVLEDQLTAVDIQTGSGVAKVAADFMGSSGPSFGSGGDGGIGTAVAVGGAGLGLGLLLSNNRDSDRTRGRR